MLKIWKKAEELGLNNIPQEIANHAGYLPYSQSWHRAFLSRYFNVGIDHFDKENFDDAYWIFSHLLEISPDDNQGARYLTVDCCLELGRHVKILDICEKYATSDKHEPYLNFSKVLAMFSTYELEAIEEYTKLSVEKYPDFAKLIAQKNKRDHYDKSHFSAPGSISGDKEEAKYYWNQQGKFWNENIEALNLVRELYKKHKGKMRSR